MNRRRLTKTVFISSLTTITLAVTGLYTPAGSKGKGILIAKRSFRIGDNGTITEYVDNELGKLDKKTFCGKRSNDEDRVALDGFISTLTFQAKAEGWRNLGIELWVAGVDAPAGYRIRYQAVDALGKPVKGGGTIVIDKKTAAAYIGT